MCSVTFGPFHVLLNPDEVFDLVGLWMRHMVEDHWDKMEEGRRLVVAELEAKKW
jgi:hypothetical protein